MNIITMAGARTASRSDGPPHDFDQTIHPIVARHFFGLRPVGPILDTVVIDLTRRTLGPGERAAARACLKRGLRVITGGGP